MSLAKEIRADLADNPASTAGEITERCPSAQDGSGSGVAALLKAMIDRGQATRTGTPGAYRYTLNPDYVQSRSNAATASPDTPPPKRPIGRAARKPKRPAPAAESNAKPARAPAQKQTSGNPRSATKAKPASTRRAPLTLPARIEPMPASHWVALQTDGSVLVMDRTTGNYTELPPHVATQVAQLAHLAAR